MAEAQLQRTEQSRLLALHHRLEALEELEAFGLASDSLPSIRRAKVAPHLLAAELPVIGSEKGISTVEWTQGIDTPECAVPIGGCLTAFRKLADEEDGDRDVLRFVLKYGALARCPRAIFSYGTAARYQEAVAWYRFEARRLRATLRAARMQKEGEICPAEEWALAASAGDWDLAGLSPASTLRLQRNLLGVAVTAMLHEVQAAPRFRYEPDGVCSIELETAWNWRPPMAWCKPTRRQGAMAQAARGLLLPPPTGRSGVRCHASPLYAILVMQITSALLSPYGIRQCKECGEEFPSYDHRREVCSVECRKARRKVVNANYQARNPKGPITGADSA